jgi:predicted permease
MRRSAAFTCVSVLSLAFGIGAVTATFVVIDAFMLRGLPVRDPGRLVAFSTSDNSTWGRWPYAAFTRWRSSPDAPFEAAAASDGRSFDLQRRGSDVPADIRVSLVSANYFQVLGAGIALGRAPTDRETAASGSAALAVISDAFWERWFGRTPDVLAQTVELHGVTYQVVGVAQKGFVGHSIGHPSDVWIPLVMQSALTPDAPGLLEDPWGTGPRWLRIVGRLRDGVSAERAAAAADVIHQRFVAEQSAALGANNPSVVRARKQTVALLTATTGYAPERARYARPLMILWAITTLVLLVACANFTNLMLARSEGQRREFVIRLALGAGRWRLIRQSATECIVLAILAGGLGLLFANWATTAALKQFAVMIMPVDFALTFDARVLGFAGACVVMVVAFGIWPCTRPARAAAVSSVYESTSSGGRARTRTVAARVILVGQLAMCTILLIGAGLLFRTVTNLRSQELGFDRNVLLVPVSPSQAGYSDQAAGMLIQRIRERLSAVPGLTAIGTSGPALMDYTNYWVDGSQVLTTDRGEVAPGAKWTSAAVGPGFFEAVGMSLVDGRAFSDADAHPSADVAVINHSLATFLFGDQNPIGRRIRMNPRGHLHAVIGVVNDAKQVSPRDRGMGVVYLPLRGFGHVVLAVRTIGPPADAAPVIRHQLTAIAGDLPIEKVRTIAEVLDNAIAQERLMSAIGLFLGALVISIGCVGLYALMAYNVARRTRELGIRLALGATSRRVVLMVLQDSAAVVLPGLAIGVPLGVAASRSLSSQLYGVQAHDLGTVVAVALTLAVVALLATVRPAQIAARIDPIALLRAE